MPPESIEYSLLQLTQNLIGEHKSSKEKRRERRSKDKQKLKVKKL